MNYIIFDLEWNQSSLPELENKAIPFEIIEIGAVKLNSDRQMVDRFHALICPQVYREMHKMTRDLIHLQMKELKKNGDTFVHVAKRFLKWCGDDIVFCSWGPLDLTELQRNMAYYHMPPLSDGPMTFLDIQKLFSIACEDRKSRRSLEYAVDFLRIEKDIPFHRAFSDAYYTAKVLERLDREVEKNLSFDLFHKPADRSQEVHIVFDDYAKYISRKFPDKTEAFKDREVCSTKCFFCRRNLLQNVSAIFIFFNHLLYAVDLPYYSVEPRRQRRYLLLASRGHFFTVVVHILYTPIQYIIRKRKHSVNRFRTDK